MTTEQKTQQRWKLVPVEPINEMVFDGAQTSGVLDYDLVATVYRTMLAASPAAPEAAKPETELAELPPLPDAIHTYQAHGGERIPAFSAKQMQDYARSALLAAGSKAGWEPIGWRLSGHGFATVFVEQSNPPEPLTIEEAVARGWCVVYDRPQQQAKPLTESEIEAAFMKAGGQM